MLLLFGFIGHYLSYIASKYSFASITETLYVQKKVKRNPLEAINNPRIHVQEEEGWEPKKPKDTSEVGRAFRNIKLSMC